MQFNLRWFHHLCYALQFSLLRKHRGICSLVMFLSLIAEIDIFMVAYRNSRQVSEGFQRMSFPFFYADGSSQKKNACRVILQNISATFPHLAIDISKRYDFVRTYGFHEARPSTGIAKSSQRSYD